MVNACPRCSKVGTQFSAVRSPTELAPHWRCCASVWFVVLHYSCAREGESHPQPLRAELWVDRHDKTRSASHPFAPSYPSIGSGSRLIDRRGMHLSWCHELDPPEGARKIWIPRVGWAILFIDSLVELDDERLDHLPDQLNVTLSHETVFGYKDVIGPQRSSQFVRYRELEKFNWEKLLCVLYTINKRK